MMRRAGRVGLAALLATAACKGDGDQARGKPVADPHATAAAPDRPPVAPTAQPSGVAQPRDFNFPYGKGEKAYEPVAKALAAGDLAAVRTAAEATVVADPGHLDAHRHLASALAQAGDTAGALDHLRVALAGDVNAYADGVAKDAALAALRGGPDGPALSEFVASRRAELGRLAREGVVVVARRSAFKPAKGDKGRVSPRAEVMAYDVAARRFVRLSHTGWQVAGALRSPSGDELAYVTYGEVTAPGRGVFLAKVKVGVRSLGDLAAPAIEASVPSGRTIVVGYGAGDQLFVRVLATDDDLASTDPDGTFTLDRSKKKLVKGATMPADAALLRVRYESVELAGTPPTGIDADWAESPRAAEEFVIAATSRRVAVPNGKAAARRHVALSPTGAHLAFATTASPCGEPAARARALYLVEAESGKLKHVVDLDSPLHLRFASAELLTYDDGEGQVHVYDAAAGRELVALGGKLGAGLVGLGAARGSWCYGDPNEGALEDDDVELPDASGELDGEPAGARPGPAPAAAPAEPASDPLTTDD